jgi:putative endopeptidase
LIIRPSRSLGLMLFILVFPMGLASQSSNPARAELSAALDTAGCIAQQPPSGSQSAQGSGTFDLDGSVSPCDDFFQYVDGKWIKNNPIPPQYPLWGVAMKLNVSNQDVLRGILEEAAKDKTAAPGSNWQKIGDFYASCMDESQVEAAGVKPLASEFERIAAIKDTAGLQAEISRLQRRQVRAVFDFGSTQDLKDSSQQIAEATQGGLGLPDRDYYTREDDKSKQLRVAYVQHMTNMFKLLGDDDAVAVAEAKTVMDIETSLAKASMTSVELRDPEKTYHKMTVAEMRTFTPHLAWNEYFQQVGAPAVSSLNIGQPDFFKEVDAELVSIPLSDWKTYLRWHLVNSSAQALSSKFVDENFNFYGRTLSGTQELTPRWRRCVRATDQKLGEALGQYYVERKFPPEAKAKALAMVKNLIAALHDDLSSLDWMSPATRLKAIEKLDAMRIKIGYPDKWRDYSAFKVGRGPYVEELFAGNEFEFAWDVEKIGKPVDLTEWGMTPPTVNAYYSDSRNEIVFPAGILQPPYFDPHVDDAMNYGNMGSVIGHEMTHGFDDNGSKFDAQGNLKNWWTPEDLKEFQARGECIVKQFDSFEVEPGLHENGKLVEGESIADLGGLVISYAAFQKTLEGKPVPAPIDGLTADQRFFVGNAEGWADSFRPEFARLIVNTNPHPLDRFRLNGPLSNMPQFAKAFHCSEKSPMVRLEALRCRIW